MEEVRAERQDWGLPFEPTSEGGADADGDEDGDGDEDAEGEDEDLLMFPELGAEDVQWNEWVTADAV